MLLEGLYCLGRLEFGYSSLNSEGKQIKRYQGDWALVLLDDESWSSAPWYWVQASGFKCTHFNAQYQLPLLALSLEVNMEDLETLGQRITNY